MSKRVSRLSQVGLAVAALSFSSLAAAQSVNGPLIYFTDDDRTGDPGLYIWWDDNNSIPIARFLPGAVDTSIIYSPLIVDGAVTSEGIVNTGTLSQAGSTFLNGPTSITGTTTINTTDNGNTTIGGGTSVNTLQGATNNLQAVNNNITATGTNTITGVTAINTGTGNGNTTIGNAANNVAITGSVNSMTAAQTNTISSNVSNTIASNGSNIVQANVSNVIQANSTNSIQAPINNIGTIGVSNNTLGNSELATRVTTRGGNTVQQVRNNVATTVVGVGEPNVDSSNLTGATQGTVAAYGAVLKGATSASQALVDANGRIYFTDGSTAAAQSSSAMTLTNGLGNVHGLVVTESQSTLSGGTNSSSLTLSDTNARFSNAATGAPITVTGVADGRADFDAVNVRQFAGAIAAVTAQANVPALAADQDKSVGVGVGNFMGKTGLALGLNVRGAQRSVYKLSVSTGLNGGAKAVVGAGAAWAF